MHKRNLALLILLGIQFFSTTINAGIWNFCCGSRRHPARIRTWAHEHQNAIANAASVLATTGAASLMISRVNRAMTDKTPSDKVNVWASIIKPALYTGTTVKLVLMTDQKLCDLAKRE